jgi:hypothetical protein
MSDDTAVAGPPRWAEYLPVADLVPAPTNAKAHDQAALATSVDTFGFVEPVVLDERTGRLVAGHGRADHLAALQAAGKPAPEGVLVDKAGTWLVLVTRGWRSRDDDHAKAAGIALNRVGELGGWHQQGLAADLQALRDVDLQLLGAAGFTADYLDDLLASFAPPEGLADQANRLGQPQASDFWPVLRFKVPPEVRDRYQALVADVPGGDAEQFTHLLDRAAEATP